MASLPEGKCSPVLCPPVPTRAAFPHPNERSGEICQFCTRRWKSVCQKANTLPYCARLCPLAPLFRTRMKGAAKPANSAREAANQPARGQMLAHAVLVEERCSPMLCPPLKLSALFSFLVMGVWGRCPHDYPSPLTFPIRPAPLPSPSKHPQKKRPKGAFSDFPRNCRIAGRPPCFWMRQLCREWAEPGCKAQRRS